jgi:hypothetical protein
VESGAWLLCLLAGAGGAYLLLTGLGNVQGAVSLMLGQYADLLRTTYRIDGDLDLPPEA